MHAVKQSDTLTFSSSVSKSSYQTCQWNFSIYQRGRDGLTGLCLVVAIGIAIPNYCMDT